jgi:hypothetical protein
MDGKFITALVPGGVTGLTTVVAGAPWYWSAVSPTLVFLAVWTTRMAWGEWFARKPPTVRRDILEYEALVRGARRRGRARRGPESRTADGASRLDGGDPAHP